MKPIIEVKGLSKKYKYGESQPYYTLRDSLTNLVKPSRSGKLDKNEFWALKDISFDAKEGDALGIIGSNGAGKSTLLKILSRITPPTLGSATLRGRVGSLLEVGTGFQQELTGRENIYLNGAILGMTRREINKKFDEIVDFAGIDMFLDTPVKHYSSGMYMRLAFAVAANLDSEILLVDEVLAVGDGEFQKKCLRKMDSISGEEGRTIIFISHSMTAIEQLCNRCILLEKGKIKEIGTPHTVVGNYLSSKIDRVNKPKIEKHRNTNTINSPICIEDIYIKGYKCQIPRVELGVKQTIVVSVDVKRKITNGNISIILHNSDGIKTDMAFSLDDSFYLDVDKGHHKIEFTKMAADLVPGRYSVSVGLNQSTNTIAWDSIEYFPIFDIENRRSVINWDSRPWAVHHSQDNEWKII